MQDPSSLIKDRTWSIIVSPASLESQPLNCKESPSSEILYQPGQIDALEGGPVNYTVHLEVVLITEIIMII